MSLYSGKSADEVSASFLILCQMRYWVIQVTEPVPGSPGKLSSQGSLGCDLFPAMQHVLRTEVRSKPPFTATKALEIPGDTE